MYAYVRFHLIVFKIFLSLFKSILDSWDEWWSESHSVVSDSLQPNGPYFPWNSPGQNTGVGSLSLLQGRFSTQDSNPDLPHCRQILNQLNHKGSPRILKWVAYLFSRRSSRPRNPTRVSCISDGFFTNWTIREALICGRDLKKKKKKSLAERYRSCATLKKAQQWALIFSETG